MFIAEALFTLISKKVKSLATQDRHRHWLAEADNLEKTLQEGRTREIYSITRIYSGKRRPVGDLRGRLLESP